MPIRPEMRARYPENWPEIRERILARAGNRCEWCSVPNHNFVVRDADGEIRLQTDDPVLADSWDLVDRLRVVEIVLTIAHVHDPDPAACEDDNLAALCQRCHNRHDAPMRARNRYMNQREGRALGELF